MNWNELDAPLLVQYIALVLLAAGYHVVAGGIQFTAWRRVGEGRSGRRLMAKRHKSAMKRMRQDEKRHLRNVSVKSFLKTITRRIERLIVQKDASNAESVLRHAVSAFDKAAGKGIIHVNKAARKKASLSRKVYALQRGG
jgi:small subunit ribosomal protein S20